MWNWALAFGKNMISSTTDLEWKKDKNVKVFSLRIWKKMSI